MALSSTDHAVMLTAIAPRLDAVVNRTVARAKQSLGEYEQVDADELRAGIVADLQRALAALVDDRPLNDDDHAGMSEIGELRARQGVPLEAMLQVYRFTIDEIFNELWEVSDAGTIDPAHVVQLTRQIWRYADPMMDVAVQAYRRRELEQAVAEGHGRTALVQRLLLSPGGLDAPAGLVASQLDPAADYVAIRARADDARELLLQLGTPGLLDDGAAAPHEGDVIAFARRRPRTAPRLPGAIVAVGPAGPLHALPHSLSVASRLVETAAAYGRGGVVTIDELAFAAIARSEDTIGSHLVARFVAPCAPGSAAGDELLATISLLLDHDLSVEHTAAALFVHPNTVRNRLRRYEQLTGSSLRSVDDLCAIRLALLRTKLS